MSEVERTPFMAQLAQWQEEPIGTDDLLLAVLPLMRQVEELHAQSKVAPLDGVDELWSTGGQLWFENASAAAPHLARGAVEKLQTVKSKAFAVTGEQRHTSDDDKNRIEVDDLSVGTRGSNIDRPVYLPDYRSWEHGLEHHDALTDIFCLGQLMASLGCRLDLTEDDDLNVFVQNRRSLHALNKRLHPVVTHAIERMTELDRHERAQDLPSIRKTLERYREQELKEDIDLSKIDGFVEADEYGRRKVIQSHLRSRLFEISRRNRLIYFKSTGSTLNLTESSVPHVLDHETIQPDQLLTWQGEAARDFSSLKTVPLGRYLRFEDLPYLGGSLDKIRLQARRDRAEYGFSQLRLVICFLRWHNVKENADERINSPLLLQSVDLAKKKGVRDSYVLTPLSELAEVNPALRHHLRQLYGIELPEFVDLSIEGSIDSLFHVLVEQIQASEPGITLQKIAKPHIKFIHSRVRRRLEAYRKRVRLTGRGVRRYGDLDYSYRRDKFQPLGLQLFNNRVKPSPAPNRDLLDEPKPKLSGNQPIAPGGLREVEKKMYSLASDPEASPYRWSFDLCALTLANFNYRKMSLVRDYSTLVREEPESHQAFDALFSTEARGVDKQLDDRPLADRHPVVPSDPTQEAAVARARTGSSYIIQGPPGTGKSQTITNLIADYMARGKRVLFVCEKRAAIDVVFHRLRQCGLDPLCCLIHDSQGDKKSFIQDLKKTYERWLRDDEQPPGANDASPATELARTVSELGRFSDAMTQTAKGSQRDVLSVMRQSIALSDKLVKLSARERELLPGDQELQASLNTIGELCLALEASAGTARLSEHPARLLRPEVFDEDRPVSTVADTLERVRPLLGELKAKSALAIVDSGEASVATLFDQVSLAHRMRALLQGSALALLDEASETYRRFQAGHKLLRHKVEELQVVQQRTTGWTDKLVLPDLRVALAQARSFETKFWAFLLPAWWRLRRVLRSRFDFAAATVRPSWLQILENLHSEYEARDTVAKTRSELAEDHGIDDLDSVQETLQELKDGGQDVSAAERALREFALSNPKAHERIADLGKQADKVELLHSELDGVLEDYGHLDSDALEKELAALHEGVESLTELAGVMRSLRAAPAAVRRALRELPLEPAELEAAVCDETVERSYRSNRTLARFNGQELGKLQRELRDLYGRWLDHNAGQIVRDARDRFLRKLALSTTPAAQLSPEEKLIKKELAAGRRELEKEFGKVMRFKSIRDLSAGKSGSVIRDLKPVWLMSPLSVADTLPLVETFDVVIFDEASQIPLEDAIPTIYRAPQVIVVGDEKQLPPTNFFGTQSRDEEELEVENADGEVESFELDADSFLSHAASTLSSTLLCWHYRSRSEALISFCNRSFYDGELLTIPTVSVPGKRTEIRSARAGDGFANAGCVHDRPISFHRMEESPYSQRRNAGEADYIAELVRGIFAEEGTPTIGIVAFSEAQQEEIERALARLAGTDAAFRRRLDEEEEREEDDQFCGLFVKNLENVQGDERDIIILSICYGYNHAGRMRMNFGPINKSGGEKRLNVIFSRAKSHMAVVSSIDYSDITNEYNDGANCLRNYLRYAAAISAGSDEEATRVLSSLSRNMQQASEGVPADPVRDQIADALIERGFEVDAAVGDSEFRCDLAIRRPGAERYELAVVLDTAGYYRGPDLLERYLLKSEVLRAFGWNVSYVLTKDWREDRDKVLDALIETLTGTTEPCEPEPQPQPG